MNVLNLSSGRRCLLNLTKCRHPARFSSTHLSHEVVTDRNLFVEVSKTPFLSTPLICLGILSNLIWSFFIFLIRTSVGSRRCPQVVDFVSRKESICKKFLLFQKNDYYRKNVVEGVSRAFRMFFLCISLISLTYILLLCNR